MGTKRVWKWAVAGIATIVILVTFSISRYQGVILKAREEVLAQNLVAMRGSIQHYIENKQRAPQSLQDLVDAGYFRELPTDPITNSNSSWKPVMGSVVTSHGRTDHGVADVHSGSNSISLKGTAYGSW